MIKKELLDIIACSKCKAPVQIKDRGLYCQNCDLLYPVINGVPVMLIEKAKHLSSSRC